MAGCLPDIEALAPDDLKGLVLQLLEDVVALKAENAALREEIARLKGCCQLNEGRSQLNV